MKNRYSESFAFVAGFVCAAPALAQWLPDYQRFSIQRVGLYGTAHTGSGGLQQSTVNFASSSGLLVGSSTRYSVSGLVSGQDAWIWNGATTIQVGLVGATYIGSGGDRYSLPQFVSSAGQVAGHTRRYSASGAPNGSDSWVWNGASTTQIGLNGDGYLASTGQQISQPVLQSASGAVVGYSVRFAASGVLKGQDAWRWNGSETTQIGFTGVGYTSDDGFQYSGSHSQDAAGNVLGYSKRFSAVGGDAGESAWVWSGSIGRKLGLAGAAYVGAGGFEYSTATLQNGAGQVAGRTSRFGSAGSSQGADAWVWNGEVTTQIGLSGEGYTGRDGVRFSNPLYQNASGQVVGFSNRHMSTSAANNGTDAWVWNGSNTTRIGLAGPGYTTNNQYQISEPQMQNNAGQVVGVSQRFTPTGLNNGRDAWIWNGSSTLQIGLTGANYTGSAGYQTSDALRQNEAGQVVGISFRYTGLSTSNGQDAWVWNGSSTVRVGMSGPGYTGSAGYQFSNIRSQNSVGQVVGVSNRYTGVRTAVGQDAWYYDPIAQTSIAIIGSVRASDNYSFSECGVLTQGGFLLGNYTFFPGGAGPGQQRAFIFRPDLGFTDLGNLVSGGLTLSGWQSLRNPIFTDALNTIVGYGYVNGQTSGQSVFVMTIPTPGITLVVCVGGWLAATRRRVKQLRAASQLATTVS